MLGNLCPKFGENMKIAIGLLAPQDKEMPEDMGMGLLDEPMVDESKYPISKESNDKMTKALMDTRHLGPVDPAKPGSFWIEIADFWGTDEESAKDMRCANCEYFDNTLEAKNAMSVVPMSTFDKTGGNRGYCHKYTFICHDLRVCDQWEEKEYEDDEE